MAGADLDSVELKLSALLREESTRELPQSSMIGEVIADTYEINRPLGEGGMGRVYAAAHLRTGGEVALKLIRPRHADKERFAERFEHEARNTAALNHPNIVKVFDYGRDHQRRTFIAMELAAGQSLRALLEERGVLSEADAIDICAHTLRALQVAHDAGLVHRDIKPDNILVAHDGDSWFVKVVDFGIAQALGADRGPRAMTGSPHCMAPEQFQADPKITPRSDLYALGCTMYAMLSGKPPFDGTFWELAVIHAEQAPPPLEGVAEPLADWVHWLLSKAPGDRPESARVALQGLLDLKGAGHVSSPVVAPNLPRVTTSFVGRSDELAALAPLRGGREPLVTLTGVGGIGKTRLAIEWGHANARSFKDGAYFCDLSETKTTEGVCIAVAQALGASLGEGNPIEAVGRAIAARGDSLVILDNFEQLVEHAPATVGEWRRAAPHATFLVTSRHRLEMPDERVVDVASLATDTIAGDGVQLFLDRAAQARPDFPDDTETRARVRDIVQQLDGLPLAIELAAARMRTVTPQVLLDRLGERFRLLRTSRPDIPARQMTMLATLDWSWSLLSAAEQAALRQCGAFARSFDLQAAEAVFDLTDYGDPWVIDVLESLVDKSLVRRVAADRFALFVSVHDYATRKLNESPESESVRTRHLAYYARMGTDEVLGRCDVERTAFDAHGREVENLQTAVAFGCRAAPSDNVARCAIALMEYQQLRGPLLTGIELGERVLEVLPDSVQKGRLHGSVGMLHVRTGDYTASLQHTGRCLELCESSGDRDAAAAAMIQHGFVHLHFLNLDAASPLLDRGRELANQTSLVRWQAAARLFHAILPLQEGRMQIAMPRCEEALAYSIEAGNKRVEGWTRRIIAQLHQALGEMDEAFEHARRSLDLAVELGETGSEAWALYMLADVLTHAGRFSGAIAHYNSCLRVAEECGETFLIGGVLCSRAEAAAWWGHPDARVWAEEALDAVADGAGQEPNAARAKLTLASLRAEESPDVALQMHDEVVEQLEGWPGPPQVDARLRRLGLLVSTRPSAEVMDEVEAILELTSGSGARALEARCLAEKTRLHLALGELDAATAAAQATHRAMPFEKMPGWLQLEDVCVRAQLFAATGCEQEAHAAKDRAVAMREDFGLYPASPLAKHVNVATSSLEQ